MQIPGPVSPAMSASVSELWNELVVLIRSISADLSELDAADRFSKKTTSDTYARLTLEIVGFEKILDGLPNDVTSLAKLLSSAQRIGKLTGRLVLWEADLHKPSERPLQYEVLTLKSNDLLGRVHRVAWDLPKNLRLKYFPELTQPGETTANEINAAINRLQEYQKATESRQMEIERSVSELGGRVEKKFSQFELQAETAFASMRSEFDREGKALLDDYEAAKVELTKRRNAIDQLLGVLASKAIGGGYMRNALKEEKLADGFRNTAVVLMVALGIYLVGAIASMELKSIDPQQSMVRGTGVLFFSFVIGYLIRQSAVHRAQQHRYQRTAFDLKAIDPFLADLPPEARQAIKLQLADKIFVPTEVLAASDSAGFGWAEVAIKAIDKAKSVKEKNS